ERGDEGVERIKELTGGLGAHSIVEAVGTRESILQAIHATRPGGHVGFVGVAHGVELPAMDLFWSLAHLHGGPAPVRRFLPDEIVTRTPVSYKNRFGIGIAADLYRPKDFDESQEHPAIIVGAPYGGVKEQGPGIYAQNMALRGFVALTFDPSFNGFSGGEPRH